MLAIGATSNNTGSAILQFVVKVLVVPSKLCMPVVGLKVGSHNLETGAICGCAINYDTTGAPVWVRNSPARSFIIFCGNTNIAPLPDALVKIGMATVE